MNTQRCFNYLLPVIGLCAMLFISAPVLADDWTDRVSIHGFMTAAFQKTDQDTAAYEGGLVEEGGITSDGSALGTRYGLNIIAEINHRITLASQITMERSHSYEANLDWAFISVNINENFDIRAGRIKFPGGLLSEYVDAGYSYPWIEPPREMYSEHVGASQAVHDSYSGISFLAAHHSGDMTYTANLFAGEVVEEVIVRKGFSGITLEANWDDKIIVLATVNSSTMETDGVMAMMDGEDHDITQFGLKVDWNDFIVYTEFADVDMGNFKFGEAKTNYATLGYRFGDFMPHITVSNLEKSQNVNTGMMMLGAILRPFEQTTTTLGLRWDLIDGASVKFEVSNIELDSIDSSVAGYGLFDRMPDDDSVTRYGIAIDAVF